MHIEFYVEEPSANSALQNILPAILNVDTTFQIYTHNGKLDLLRKLPDRLKRYSYGGMPEDWRIAVLIDEDREDCKKLKAQLDQAAYGAGLTTKSSRADQNQPFQVLNRIIVEELEAWFFGDINALKLGYPNISTKLGQNRKYRDPDAITGGTWEALEREFVKAGYTFSKGQVAREVSKHMSPELNRSRSFQVFRTGLLELIGE